MKSRNQFAVALAKENLSHVERAIALLWYYRQSQEFDERTASELAADLHEEHFSRPNVTRLKQELARSRYTIRGKRKGTFQINVQRNAELDEKYAELANSRRVEVSDAIVPQEMVEGTRVYLEKLVHQINGSYDAGFYDASAVLCRRLMETLIIEIYISRGRQNEIQRDHVFLQLDGLIAHLKADRSIPIARGSSPTMDDIKQLGDTAAHNRTYITHQSDIDDLRARFRRLISDLLDLSEIVP